MRISDRRIPSRAMLGEPDEQTHDFIETTRIDELRRATQTSPESFLVNPSRSQILLRHHRAAAGLVRPRRHARR